MGSSVDQKKMCFLNKKINCMELGQEFITGGFTQGTVISAQLRLGTSDVSYNACRDVFRFSFSHRFSSRVLFSVVFEHRGAVM